MRTRFFRPEICSYPLEGFPYEHDLPHVFATSVGLHNSLRELVLVMEYMSGGDLFSFIKKHREKAQAISDKVRSDLTRSVFRIYLFSIFCGCFLVVCVVPLHC